MTARDELAIEAREHLLCAADRIGADWRERKRDGEHRHHGVASRKRFVATAASARQRAPVMPLG